MTDVDPRPLPSFTPVPITPSASGTSSGPKAWQNGETASFRDVLAIINPLQHIPVVGTIYRAITGDTIAAMPSIIGGTLFGGPVGFVLSLADNAVKAETGKNVGETVIAGLFGAPADKPTEPLVAAKGSEPSEARPKLVIDIPAPRPGEFAPQPFADGKPPVVINLPQPKWALEAASAQPKPAAGSPGPTAQPALLPQAGLPLTFQTPPALAQARAPAADPAKLSPAPSLPTGPSPLLNARFRSTDLPPPQVDGGVQSHSGADLVPTPVGTPITRDAVPNAMVNALDKYAAMMRARQVQPLPTQVSVLR